MSNIAVSASATGTGTVTLAAPVTNTNRTITLPDSTGTLINADASGNVSVVSLAVSGSVSGFSGGEVRLGTTAANAQNAISTIGTGIPQMYFDHRGSNIGEWVWRSGSNERARIDSSGNLLVGTTSSFGSAKLQIGFDGSTTDGGRLRSTFSNGGTAFTFQNSSGTAVGTIQLSNTTTTYNTSSDYRLKNSIAPMTDALAKVAALKPCTYKWNADGSAGEGFIAHELAEVCPQAVTGEKDAVDADGKPQYQGIDVSFLVGTLTAAIHELKAIVDAQGAEIAALKGQP